MATYPTKDLIPVTIHTSKDRDQHVGFDVPKSEMMIWTQKTDFDWMFQYNTIQCFNKKYFRIFALKP